MTAAPQLKPYHFKPGQSGNPSGKPRIPDHLRSIKALSQTEACLLISKYARLSKGELELLATTKIAAVDHYIIAMFLKGIKEGTFQNFEILMDRAIGAAPKCDDNPEEIAIRQELNQLSDEQLIRVIKEDPLALESLKISTE